MIARCLVWFLRDAGRQWLRQIAARSSFGMAVADDGVHLLMGSTTGNLWAGGDGGEHWASVSQHLPPIYAVRFG